MLDPEKLSALRQRIVSLDAAKRALLRQQLEDKGIEWSLVDPDAVNGAMVDDSAPGSTLKPLPRPEFLPLSASQAHVWVLHQLYADLTAYHIAYAWSLRGQLQPSAMQDALHRLVARHESLRTVFPAGADGQPYQLIRDELSLSFDIESISVDAEPDQQHNHYQQSNHHDPLHNLPEAVQKRAMEFASQRFNLEFDPLFKVLCLELEPQHHVMVLVMHHMVADGWSRGVLMHELAAHYNAVVSGKTATLHSLPMQYADYVLHQQNWRSSEAGKQQLDYWHQQLQGMTQLELCTDHPRPAGASFSCRVCANVLPHSLNDKLKSAARNNGVTQFMLLLAVFKLLMARYSGQEDIAVGVPVSGRLHQEFAGSIGFFVNTLVMRTRFDNEDNGGDSRTFRDWLEQVKETVAGALEHQAVAFSDVVDACAPERSSSRNPLFEVMFQAQTDGYQTQNSAMPDIAFTELTLEQHPVLLPQTKFDMSWHMMERDDGLVLAVEYRDALYEASSIRRMMLHLRQLLEAVVDLTSADSASLPLSALSMLTVDETAQLNEWEHGAAFNADSRPAHQRFLDCADQHPAASALFSRQQETGPLLEMDYASVRQHSRCLAHSLIALHGIGHGKRVAVLLPRTVQLPISVLAILMSGASYVPLDRNMPVERLRYIVEDAGVDLLLHANDARYVADCFSDSLASLDVEATTPTLASMSISPDHVLPETSMDSTAYIIYTSGSTGHPKGVEITHAALGNFLDAMSLAPGISREDILLAVTTIAFDISILELLLPLCHGACVVLASSDDARDADTLAAMLDDYHISIMQASPASWRLLMANNWAGRSELRMLCGGEALDASLANQLLDKGGELWNMYGPTETTIWSAALRVDHTMTGAAQVPIGAPILNTRFLVADKHLRRCPVQVMGELLIGGAGLAQGYWQRSELTADRFIVDPSTGERLYRTGDLVRRREDGLLDFMGRADFQVKLRGHRIELGEIEAALDGCEGVEHAVVIVMPDAQHEAQLVAFIVADITGDGQVETNRLPDAVLRDTLARTLPKYMIPARFQWLESMALTLSGKIDRKALPALLQTAAHSDANREAQAVVSTPMGELVADVWCELLAVKSIAAEDNFFELGGHSLTATRLMTRLRTALGVDLSLALLFDHPRFSDFVTALALQNSEIKGSLKISTLARDTDTLPVSPAQRRQWLMAGLVPDNPMYGMPTAVRLSGELDVEILRWCLTKLAARHENLRVCFIERDGEPVAQVVPEMHVELQRMSLIEQLSDLPDDEQQQKLEQVMRKQARMPFNLEQTPLWRALLIETGSNDYVLTLTLHHILADGWSMGVLVREMAALYQYQYQGQHQDQSQNWQADVLPALPVQYADYAAWVSTRDHGDDLDYWQQQLAGLPMRIDLPTDFPYPSEPSYEGNTYHFHLDIKQRDALIKLGQTKGSTLFMTLLTAFAVLLNRITGSTDIAIGTPDANRGHSDIEGLIGLFVNTLVMRIDLEGDPQLAELLRRTRETTLAGWQHQQAPFEEVLDRLNIERSRSHSPLFQVMFTLQNAPFHSVVVEDLEWSPMSVESGTAKFDLSCVMHETAEGLDATIEYRSDLFSAETIERIAKLYTHLLEQLPAVDSLPLSQLPSLDEITRIQLQDWSRTQTAEPAPEKTVHQLFSAQTNKTPQAVALVQGEQEMSYRGVEQFANRIAHLLLLKGVNTESAVMLLAERSLATICAMIGVLKAGAIYVPLDPSLPTTRQQMLIDDAGAQYLLSASSKSMPDGLSNIEHVCIELLHDELMSQPDMPPNMPPDRVVTADNLAYIMYTSGSTGQAKGVCTPHRGITRLVKQSPVDERAFARFSKNDVFLQVAPLGFDAATLEIWGALLNGGRLVLPTENTGAPLALDALLELVEKHGVTTLWLTSGLFNLVVDLQPQKLASVSQLLAGGDVLSVEHLRKAHAALPATQLINGYGPTENTTFTCCHRFSDAELMTDSELLNAPVGRPIAHTSVYVLNENMQQVLPGVAGELYIGGQGLARGYLGQAAMTAEYFVPNPFFDAETENTCDAMLTLYRTGDRGRWRKDGSIEFLGRFDTQVKIRGFRIEPGEIEHALINHPLVADAVVVATGETAQQKRLLAYLVVADGIIDEQKDEQATSMQPAQWRHYLLERLPVQMVPSAYIWLAQLPLNANGKVDVSALPEAEWNDVAGQAEVSDDDTRNEAENETEKALLDIWRQLLPAAEIHRGTNFFNAGGDSIIALQIVSHASRAGLAISPMQIFQYQSVAELAVVTEQVSAEDTQLQQAEGAVSLLPIQHWYFQQQPACPQYFNQSVAISLPAELDRQRLEQALSNVVAAHDAFRLRFVQNEYGAWRQSYCKGTAEITLMWHDLSGDDYDGEQCQKKIDVTVNSMHSSLQLDVGPVLKAVMFDRGNAGHLLVLVAHHLVVDGVSWRILFDDLSRAYMQPDVLLAKAAASYQLWSATLANAIGSLAHELAYWREVVSQAVTAIPCNATVQGNSPVRSIYGRLRTYKSMINETHTQQLLQDVTRQSGYDAQQLLLTALVQTMTHWCEGATPTISMETHGRDASALGIELDVSRTVGWFTAIYPVTPVIDVRDSVLQQLSTISKSLIDVPGNGIGYGLLRYLAEHKNIELKPAISFNYLGQLDAGNGAQGSIERERVTSPLHAAENPRAHLIDINAWVAKHQLSIEWSYDKQLHDADTIETLAAAMESRLKLLIDECVNMQPCIQKDMPTNGAKADEFELAGLDDDALSAVLSQVRFGTDD